MANKANYHLLATSRSELRAPSNFFTPQSLRDSPRWGHWGPDSPDPLRRFAPSSKTFIRTYPPSYGAEGGHGCKEVIISFGSILVIHLLII